MGYTAAFEPAMLPVNARQAHMEMADTPMIDKGAFVMLGSDDYFLRLLTRGADKEEIKDYIAWSMHAAQALAVKVVNPGGISAFKFNQRKLDLDEKHVFYGVTPREIILTLGRSLQELGVPHTDPHPRLQPGCPRQQGYDTRHDPRRGRHADPSDAYSVPQLRNRRRHEVFLRCGRDRGTSEPEPQCLARHRANHVRADVYGLGRLDAPVGQHEERASEKVGRDGHRMRRRLRRGSDALQGQELCQRAAVAIGLEMFLLVNDPWRIFLTTDHPNGAPFTTYPHLIRLLMDRTFRNEHLRRIHPGAQAATILGSITREYSLYEVAIMTRAGPAKSLGLKDRGHLGPGACADITVYEDNPDREAMFTTPLFVFKNGDLIVRNGKIVKVVTGATHVVRRSTIASGPKSR